MRETLEQLVARINAGAYIPNKESGTMAKLVKLPKGKEFQFKSPKAGGESRYPWDSWLDGSLWLIERSTFDTNATPDEDGNYPIKEKRDFDVDVNAMPGKLKNGARRQYKVVQISRYDHDGKRLEDALIIKARPMTDDERAAEDELRAVEKDEAKQRRIKEKAKKEAQGGNGTADTTNQAAQ